MYVFLQNSILLFITGKFTARENLHEESFFKILEQAQVAPEDLDNTLREIAKRYKDLQTKLDSFRAYTKSINSKVHIYDGHSSLV